MVRALCEHFIASEARAAWQAPVSRHPGCACPVSSDVGLRTRGRMLNRGFVAATALLVGVGVSNCGTHQPGQGSVAAPPAVDAGGSTPPADAGSGAQGSPDAGPAIDGGSDPGADAGGGSPDAGTGGATDGGSAGGGDDAGTALVPENMAVGENATALAIDANNIYWLSINPYDYYDTGGGRYRLIDVRSMPKSGGAPATLAHTLSRAAMSIIAPGDGVLWVGSACPLPCDYPGAGHEWGIFTADASSPGGFRQIAGLYASGGDVAADATNSYARSFDTTTGRWDLLACARDGSGCRALIADAPLDAPVYLDQGMLFWLTQPTDTDFGPRSVLFRSDPNPFASRGSVPLPNATGITGLRVNGNVFALRTGGNVWSGTLDGHLAQIWKAPSGSDVDVSGGRVYWNQDQTLDGTYPGCLGSANLDGTDGRCLDQGAHSYGGVRVDDTTIFFIRDGDIYRLRRQ